MKKILLPLFMIVLIAFQAKSQSISYKVKSDNPDPKPASISAEFIMDAYASNLTMGWAVRADALLLKRIQLRGEYRRSFFEMEEIPNSAGTGNLHRNWMEVGGSLYFSNRTLDRNLKVVLSSNTTYSGGYKYTTSKFIYVPGTVRKQVGLRAGLINIVTPLKVNRGNVAGNITQDDIDKIVYTQDTSGKIIPFNQDAVRMGVLGTLYAGIEFNKMYDLKIYADGYGTRRSAMYSNFYMDVAFAPVITIKDMSASNLDLKSEARKHIGWRMGWMMRYPRSTFMTIKYEWGGLPGITNHKGLFGSRAYFLMTIGLNVPMSIKALEKSNTK